MRRWKRLVLPLLVAGALGAGGCGTETTTDGNPPPAAAGPAAEDTGAAPAGDDDPCRLLTREQASEVLNVQVEPGKAETGGIDGPMCSYASGFQIVSVVVTKYTTEAEITGMYETAGKMLGSTIEYEKLSGIGEAAYYAKGMNLAFLHKGRVYYVAALTAPDPKAAGIAAAKAVLSNLG